MSDGSSAANSASGRCDEELGTVDSNSSTGAEAAPATKTDMPEDDASKPVTLQPKAEERRTPFEVCIENTCYIDGLANKNIFQWIMLGFMGGFLLSVGTLLVVQWTAEIPYAGARTIIAGVALVSGFSMVIFSGSLLYTELNGAIPVYIAVRGRFRLHSLRILLMWFVVFWANYLGTIVFGILVKWAFLITPGARAGLQAVIHTKLDHYKERGTSGWFAAVASGMIANMLVSTAAYNAKEGRTNIDKFVGLCLPIMAFIGTGSSHSVANMGYFAMGLMEMDVNLNWAECWAWNIVPVSIGNVIGSILFVFVPQYLSYGLDDKWRRKLA